MTLLIWCAAFLLTLGCLVGFVLLTHREERVKPKDTVHDNDAYKRFLQFAFCKQVITLFNAEQHGEENILLL